MASFIISLVQRVITLKKCLTLLRPFHKQLSMQCKGIFKIYLLQMRNLCVTLQFHLEEAFASIPLETRVKEKPASYQILYHSRCSSAKIRVMMFSQKSWPQVMLIRQAIPRVVQLSSKTSCSNETRLLQ